MELEDKNFFQGLKNTLPPSPVSGSCELKCQDVAGQTSPLDGITNITQDNNVWSVTHANGGSACSAEEIIEIGIQCASVQLIEQIFPSKKKSASPRKSQCTRTGEMTRDDGHCIELISLMEQIDAAQVTLDQMQTEEGQNTYHNLLQQQGQLGQIEALQGGFQNQYNQKRQKVIANAAELKALSNKINHYPTPEKAKALWDEEAYGDDLVQSVTNTLLNKIPDLEQKQQFEAATRDTKADLPSPIDTTLQRFKHDLFPNQDILKQAKQKMLQIQTQMGLQVDNALVVGRQMNQLNQDIHTLKNKTDNTHRLDSRLFGHQPTHIMENNDPQTQSQKRLSLHGSHSQLDSTEQKQGEDPSLEELSPAKELGIATDTSFIELAKNSHEKGDDKKTQNSKDQAKDQAKKEDASLAKTEEEQKKGAIKAHKNEIRVSDTQAIQAISHENDGGGSEKDRKKQLLDDNSRGENKDKIFKAFKDHSNQTRHSLLQYRLPASVRASHFNIFEQISARYDKVKAANRLFYRKIPTH